MDLLAAAKATHIKFLSLFVIFFPEQVKVFFFFLLKVAEDEETQKRGMVLMAYFVGQFSLPFDPELHIKSRAMLASTPLRVCAVHFCAGNSILRTFAAALTLTLGEKDRKRLRVHDGKPLKSQDRLSSNTRVILPTSLQFFFSRLDPHRVKVHFDVLWTSRKVLSCHR
jgi:hypothetical protein